MDARSPHTIVDAAGSRQVPVTRRHVLRTGSIAAIAAGLLGTTTTPIAAAVEPSPQPDLVTMLCTAAKSSSAATFTAWLEDWKAERVKVAAQRAAIVQRLKAVVPDEQYYELIGGCDGLSGITGDQASLDDALHRELLIRHMPGLEPVVRLVWMHVMALSLDTLTECGEGWCRDGVSGPY